MRFSGRYRRFTGTIVALALCTSSTGALAASAPATPGPSISPLVVLSALGSDVSRSALCSAAAGAAAAAQAAQTPARNCVLPVVDTPPPPPVQGAEALPPPPPPGPTPAAGFGAPALLLGLVGIIGAVLLIKAFDNDNPDQREGRPPPVTPG